MSILQILMLNFAFVQGLEFKRVKVSFPRFPRFPKADCANYHTQRDAEERAFHGKIYSMDTKKEYIWEGTIVQLF